MPNLKTDPTEQPDAKNDELFPAASDGSAISEEAPRAVPSDNADEDESVSVDISDWMGSIVSDDSEEPEDDDEPADVSPSPAAPKKKKQPALSSATRTSNSVEAPVNREKQTISAIPVGPAERSSIPIFEREAVQLKFDEDRTSRTDAASIYATLKTYQSQGRPLKGRIAGVTMYNGVPCWSIFQGQVSIYIPFNESYMTIKKSMTGPLDDAKLRDQKNFLAQSIGLTVEFVLTSFGRDPDHPDCFIATASRTTALARKRAAYFGQGTLRPGVDIVCRVISVGTKEMFVTVAGLDVYVPRKHITRRYVEHLRDYYHVDDKITMRILAVDNGSSNALPSLSLSAIPLEEESCQANRHRLNPGERCRAVITWLDDGKTNRSTTGRINLWLVDYDYYATTTLNLESCEKPVGIGSYVLYEHIGFTERNFSHGKILRFLDC